MTELAGASAVQVQVARSGGGAAGTDPLTLFCVPGLDGDPEELRLIVDAMAGTQRVYVLAPAASPVPPSGVVTGPTVPGMAADLVMAMREVAPTGPYRLAGYSFGALAVLEMARQLLDAGEVVDRLILIDAVYDQQYWPRRVWLPAAIRRIGGHLARIARDALTQPVASAQELCSRASKLATQLWHRRGPTASSPRAGGPARPGLTAVGRQTRAALALYRPGFYPGRVTLIGGLDDSTFGCDTTSLWRGLIGEVDVQRVDGDHHMLVRDAGPAGAIAAIVDRTLGTLATRSGGLAPSPGFRRPLIVSTMRWFSAARLANCLADAGFIVSVCAPRRHAFDAVAALASRTRLSWLRPQRSIRRALRDCAPDVVLCDDERALGLLRSIVARPGYEQWRDLLTRALGAVEDWPLLTSRAGQAGLARELGLAAPPTEPLRSVEHLRRWAGDHPGPFVLKTDGSWGGQGVAVVDEPEQLTGAWRALSRPPGAARTLVRAVSDYRPFLNRWRRERPTVNVQAVQRGSDATVTVACIDGKVQCLVCLEVLATDPRRGPARAVRVIDHSAMAETARQLVSRLGLSGFCGFDFMIDGDRAVLLEINPRVTPTAHLLVEGRHGVGAELEFFPAIDRALGLPGALLDLPHEAPGLVEYARHQQVRQGRPIAVLIRRARDVYRPRNAAYK
jgi:thioesterase domain-containing protein